MLGRSCLAAAALLIRRQSILPAGFTGQILLTEGSPEAAVIRDGRLWVTRMKLDFEFYQDITIREASGETLKFVDMEIPSSRAAYAIGYIGKRGPIENTHLIVVGSNTMAKRVQSEFVDQNATELPRTGG